MPRYVVSICRAGYNLKDARLYQKATLYITHIGKETRYIISRCKEICFVRYRKDTIRVEYPIIGFFNEILVE